MAPGMRRYHLTFRLSAGGPPQSWFMMGGTALQRAFYKYLAHMEAWRQCCCVYFRHSGRGKTVILRCLNSFCVAPAWRGGCEPVW